MKRLIAALLCVWILSSCTRKDLPSSGGYTPVEGDFLFQSLPHNALIDAIEDSTGSPYSHCGIVKKSGAAWVVVEAIGPVKETPIALWILQGRKGAFAAYRLKPPLAQKIPAILDATQAYKGRPYDIHYDLDDVRIYCSELLWKSVRDATGRKLGTLQKLGELAWQPHEGVIRQIENGGLPLDRVMITPKAFATAPELTHVFSHPAGYGRR
jgi:hypothetical protein